MVIMAGQPETMQQLMQSEPGLRSRFPSKQVFAQRCRPTQAAGSDAVTKAKALLEKFEGCEDFKSKMQQLERSAAELRKLGRPVDGLLSNWLFVGEPHTGMVAPSASMHVLAGVTWSSHLFSCFLLYPASILAFSLPALKYDVQPTGTPVFVV